jgi:hypothetical protein
MLAEGRCRAGSICVIARLLWVISRYGGKSARCPLFPQKRTFVGAGGMSAMCHKRTLHLELCGWKFSSLHGRASALSPSSLPLTVKNAVDAGAVMAGPTYFTNGRAPPLGCVLHFAFICLAAKTARSEAGRARSARLDTIRPYDARAIDSSEFDGSSRSDPRR